MSFAVAVVVERIDDLFEEEMDLRADRATAVHGLDEVGARRATEPVNLIEARSCRNY